MLDQRLLVDSNEVVTLIVELSKVKVVSLEFSLSNVGTNIAARSHGRKKSAICCTPNRQQTAGTQMYAGLGVRSNFACRVRRKSSSRVLVSCDGVTTDEMRPLIGPCSTKRDTKTT